jgi:uncharacterized protein (DUF2141 family)
MPRNKKRGQMRHLFTILLLSLVSFGATLKVDINGVRHSRGMIYVGIYNNPRTFLTVRGIYRWTQVKAKRGRVVCKFKNIPGGRYAIALFHDENGNEKLDLNSLHIPKEGYALSGHPNLVNPTFKDSSIRVHPKKSYRIKLRMHY